MEQMETKDTVPTTLSIPVPYKARAFIKVESKDTTMVCGEVIPNDWIVHCLQCNARLNKKRKWQGWMEEAPFMDTFGSECMKLLTEDEKTVYICKACYDHNRKCPECENDYHDYLEWSEEKKAFFYEVVVVEEQDGKISVGCTFCAGHTKESQVIARRPRFLEKKETEIGDCTKCGKKFNYKEEGVVSPYHDKPIHKKCALKCRHCDNYMMRKYFADGSMCRDGVKAPFIKGDQAMGECWICSTPLCVCGFPVGSRGYTCKRAKDKFGCYDYYCSQCR